MVGRVHDLSAFECLLQAFKLRTPARFRSKKQHHMLEEMARPKPLTGNIYRYMATMVNAEDETLSLHL